MLSGGTASNAYYAAVVTSITATSGQLALSGSTTYPILGLATTAVSPGTYTLSTVTVDSYGRITSASSGSVGSTTLTLNFGGSGQFNTLVIKKNGGVQFSLTNYNASSMTMGGMTLSPSDFLEIALT